MGEQVAVVPHSDYPTPVPMNPPERDLREQQHFIAAYDTHLTCQLAELTVTNGSTGDGYYVCPVGMALLPKLMDSMDEPEVKPPTCNYSYDELLQRSKKPKHHSNGSNKYIPFHLECNEKKEEQNGGGIAAAAGGKGVAPPNPIKMPLLSIQPEGQAQEVPKVDTISDENIAYWNLLDTIKKQNVQMQLQELQKSMEAPQPPPIIHTENEFDGHNAMVSQTNRTYWQLLERINYLRQQNQQTEAMLKAQQEEMKKNQSFLLNNGSAQMQQSFTGKPIGLMAGLLQLTGHHDMMMVNGGGSITLDDKRVYNESELWNLMKWGKDQRDTQEPDQDQNDFNNNRW
ncbi:uncharacterized protein Dwil_GK19809 [Drosophila willistoni]|uniref:Uncharacterized protein n=1 Tax=Drosophila willistoni TaxID=7260 RepID=A0A0Q9WQ03_DROWI|nr:uncharacterized protein Dwil_GK19809 [Drosophila willistoni]